MNYLEKLDTLNNILGQLQKVNVACSDLGYINDIANVSTQILRAAMRAEQKKCEPESVHADEKEIKENLKFWHSQLNYWVYKFQEEQTIKQYS